MYSFAKKSVKRAFWRMLETKIKKSSKIFAKKALTKEGVFGIIVKRAGETDKRDRKNSGNAP